MEEIPGRKWQPTPVFLPGKFHGQRNLAGYRPWGRKESDMTEQLGTHTHKYPSYIVSDNIPVAESFYLFR